MFDGLTKDRLPPTTLGVILNLAIRAEKEVPELRVILLDLASNLPPEIDDVALREEIGAIDETKCVIWLKKFLELRGITTAPEDLVAAVAKMFQTLPAPGQQHRLKKLACEMGRILLTQMTPQASPVGSGGGS